jgi:hypothetical protein
MKREAVLSLLKLMATSASTIVGVILGRVDEKQVLNRAPQFCKRLVEIPAPAPQGDKISVIEPPRKTDSYFGV